jgi:adenine-specific DNA-methyltransferase
VDLIYIDPPFNAGADFSFRTTIPEVEESFLKEPSVLEQKAYRDTWGSGVTSYLKWFYDALALLRELLSETGSIYVHLDYNVAHYAKVVLDELFGPDNFRNEIIWLRTTGHSDSHKWNHSHDVLFFYSRSEQYTWNPTFLPYSQDHIDASFRNVESGTGRKFSIGDLMAGGLRKGESGRAWRGIDPAERGGHWQYPVSKLDDLDKEGRIYWPPSGRIPRLKRYLDEMSGMQAKSIWDDISPVQGSSNERTEYATQKPEALLDRIIKASSKKGNLVLDCFCGSGTTAAAAEKLNRRWIACDLGRFAIHTTRKRLLGIPGVKPFVVQNLGKYERQQWQVAEFPSNGKDRLEEQKEREAAYRKFILELYHATPVGGHAWLHGVKAGRMVHVAAVDAPVTRADVNAIATEVWKAAGKGANSPQKPAVDILGWEFALELNETAKEVAAQARVDAAFKKIPREVLEKKAVEQGDVHFFELGALSVESKIKKRELTLTLSDFVIPLDDVPAEVRSAIKHWSQMVDYWAVDWDFKDDTFHNQWQSYRTRKNPKLDLSVKRDYLEPGQHTVVVKVIDILGNDTTKTLTIEIK